MTAWQAYYEAMSNGRFKITADNLLDFSRRHPERIIETYLKRLPAKVMLLDKPLTLDAKVPDSERGEYYLRRISLQELPGWPPKLASTVWANEAPSLPECTLKKAAYLSGGGPGQGGVLLSLEHRGRKFQAWHVDCPAELLLCEQETLQQQGIPGRKLAELQEIRLIGLA